MSEARISSLEGNVTELEKTVVALTASVDARIHTEIQLEQTLRNIDDNMRALSEKVLVSPLERLRETQDALNPVYEQLRSHEKMFISRRDVIVFFSLLIFGLSIFSSMGIYILADGKADLLEGQKYNQKLIKQNAENLLNHDNMKDR